MKSLGEFLQETENIHRHLCPRQVLGVRMGLIAGKLFNLQLPQEDKRLLTISETDGCFVDGISVVTNCTVGHRTLRIEDYGKVAATFVDTKTSEAFRVVPCPEIRMLAREYAPPGCKTWDSHLIGYQRMSDDVLLSVQSVELSFSLKELISRPGVRVTCIRCGEEIINEREVMEDGLAFCRFCMFGGYYRNVDAVEKNILNDFQILQDS